MDRQRDPVQARDDGSLDLYDISTWEVRGPLDRLSVALYGGLAVGLRALVVALAVLILVAQFVLGGLSAVTDPYMGAFVALSVVPAFLLAAYIWYADVTTQEPLTLLVGTFLLGVLFAGFAGILNVELSIVAAQFGIGAVGGFFLIVGPVEEGVKLLAVRLFAFRSDRFDAVIDGAVYGAVAGLGFATIENAYYITSNAAELGTGSITTVRALAGPGHVIYSAFAGYYLGLAKFNPEDAGPIVLKGLVIAAGVHGLYNTFSSFAPSVFSAALGVPWFLGFVAFVAVFDGLFGALLVRKLQAYRRAYKLTDRQRGPRPQQADFEE
jgi:RsiW-degrading membrane proteinase PrsW (M82 family)